MPRAVLGCARGRRRRGARTTPALGPVGGLELASAALDLNASHPGHEAQPLANLQIASELVEQSDGPAPLRFRLPDNLQMEIRKLIRQRVKGSKRA